MDWRKAKIILIVVFIILNIVLSVTLYNNLKVEGITQQTITNTTTILKQNNVLIECPIPKYKGNDYTLQYEEKPLDKLRVATVLLGDNYTVINDNTYKKGSKSLVFSSNSAFDYSDTAYSIKLKSESKEDVDKYLKEELSKKIGIPYDEFKRDDYYDKSRTHDGTRIVYKGIYKDYAVFDNYIEIKADKYAVKSIKYQYKKPLSISVKEDICIIPAHEILITKMTDYPGISIKEVGMGFKGFNDKDTEALASITSYEGLSWRIKTESGQEYYFNARNGQKMQ